jgi:hypothetical protein
MVNAVILHCPGDEERARWIAGAWRGGRATVCRMEPERRRVALGAHSVMIGLWSGRSRAADGGRQMAGVLGATQAKSLLVVWDGRPPLSQAASAGVPVIVAPEEPAALLSRLQAAAERIGEGDRLASDMAGNAPKAGQASKRARMLGVAAGVCLVALAALAALISIAAQQSP